nr:protein indeterminate-domain 7-like [Ipomoea batatas]
MIKAVQLVDDSMSNLTSASNDNAISISSTQQQPSTTNQAVKRKRNQAGNPDPEAEVVALSPNTLFATNRFVCEICNKGFQRDQNLQLHRRGHNLPWKLKQRNKEEVVKKKVYVCPEASCVHHDPARALGDLTGIKKHYSRKHGEKKWKCDKCSKRYAVQSDWKAHSKICGTRDYRCDCGTLFSRRDSFITHRAFCDALAEESARSSSLTPLPNALFSTQPPPPLSATVTSLQTLHNLQATFNHLRQPAEMPPWLACPPPLPPPPPLKATGPTQFLENPNPSSLLVSPPHMSATALLQKAAQLGVTSNNTIASTGNLIRPHHHHHQNQNQNQNQIHHHMMGTAAAGFFSSREELASSYGTNKPAAGHASLTPGCMEMMGGTTGSDTTGFYYHHQGFNGGRENTDIEGLNTRDFLSLTASFSSSKGFSQNSACWPP